MHRLLFEEFEIDDQNHDFLSYKEYFIEVFKNHVFSELFKDNLSMTQYDQMKDFFDKRIIGAADNSSFYSVYEIKILNTRRNNKKYSRLEIYYEPMLPVNVKNRRISFYKIENTDMHFDHDSVNNAIVKKLKRTNTTFQVESQFSISNMQYALEAEPSPLFTEETSFKVILTGNISVIDSIWGIIKFVEEEFFRYVEKSDLS